MMIQTTQGKQLHFDPTTSRVDPTSCLFGINAAYNRRRSWRRRVETEKKKNTDDHILAEHKTDHWTLSSTLEVQYLIIHYDNAQIQANQIIMPGGIPERTPSTKKGSSPNIPVVSSLFRSTIVVFLRSPFLLLFFITIRGLR